MNAVVILLMFTLFPIAFTFRGHNLHDYIDYGVIWLSWCDSIHKLDW